MADVASLAFRSEKDLVALANRGDPKAQREIFDRHSRMVFSRAIQLLGGNAQAEDVVQQTFLKVFQNLKQFQGNSQLSSWIYTIATRVCFDIIMSLPQDVSEESLPFENAFPFVDGRLAFGEERVAAVEFFDRLRAYVSPHKWAAFWLYFVDGYTADEVAEQLGRRRSTVQGWAIEVMNIGLEWLRGER